MSKTSRWAMLLVLVVVSGGFLAYRQFLAHNQKNPDERTLEEIPQDEQEQWMQSLGYTD